MTGQWLFFSRWICELHTSCQGYKQSKFQTIAIVQKSQTENETQDTKMPPFWYVWLNGSISLHSPSCPQTWNSLAVISLTTTQETLRSVLPHMVQKELTNKNHGRNWQSGLSGLWEEGKKEYSKPQVNPSPQQREYQLANEQVPKMLG